ncbi:MAG: ferritin family protein [Rhodospirillaceae bacterium]
MANVIFSSPVMKTDVTVYAIAGHRGTVLSVAKAHKIPIPFDCGDGECGSCLIEVKVLSDKRQYGVAITEKEKEILRQLGKITPEEILDAEVNDMPPRYRMACQCFVRNEDIMVYFEGDQTLPKLRPHLTIAAPIYKGGQEISSVDEFLGYAIKVEEEAALHFDTLGTAMEAVGNTEVAQLFRQLAGYSRLHHQEALARAGSRDVTRFSPGNHVWPDFETPERTALWAGDADLSRLDALKAALHGERMGFEFYHMVAGSTTDPEIRAMARDFVKEEAEHVDLLERWIAREVASRPVAVA